MATINSDYFTGQGGSAPTGTDSQPPLATVLRDIADDLGARSAITSPAATAAAGAAPDKAEFDKVVTLINEIRTKLLTSVKTIKGSI